MKLRAIESTSSTIPSASRKKNLQTSKMILIIPQYLSSRPEQVPLYHSAQTSTLRANRTLDGFRYANIILFTVNSKSFNYGLKIITRGRIIRCIPRGIIGPREFLPGRALTVSYGSFLHRLLQNSKPTWPLLPLNF